MFTRFEVTVKYVKVDDNTGKEKKVSEVLLIETETFGNAEEIAYEWLSENTSGEVVVDAIKRSQISALNIIEEADYYYVATLGVMDDNEKVTKVKELFSANTMGGAETQVSEVMEENQYYSECFTINKTKIVDIIYHDSAPAVRTYEDCVERLKEEHKDDKPYTEEEKAELDQMSKEVCEEIMEEDRLENETMDILNGESEQ